MGACLVAAEIEQRVRVAGDCFPGILVEFLDLRHVLDDRAARNVAGTHGRKLPRQPRQIDRWRFVQDKVDMTRQCPMVDLVCTVVKRLEYLGVQQAYQKVEGRIIVRDHGIEGALFLAQCVQVHIVMVRDRLDLRQVEGSQPHSGADQDAFCRLARNELSRTFLQNKKLSTTLFFGYRKLVLYMYLYIIILQYASYGDSHNLTNRDIILTGKSQKRKLMLSKLRYH